MKQSIFRLTESQAEYLRDLLISEHDTILYELEGLVRKLRPFVNHHQPDYDSITRVSQCIIDKKAQLDTVLDLLKEICGEINMPVSGK